MHIGRDPEQLRIGGARADFAGLVEGAGRDQGCGEIDPGAEIGRRNRQRPPEERRGIRRIAGLGGQQAAERQQFEIAGFARQRGLDRPAGAGAVATVEGGEGGQEIGRRGKRSVHCGGLATSKATVNRSPSAKGIGAVPHGRGEQDEPAGLRLDRPERPEIEAERSLRLAELQPARLPGAHRLGQGHVECRAEPALRMEMIGVEAGAVEPHRPGAREADRSALRNQRRMPRLRSRQLGDVTLDGGYDRGPQRADLRLDPGKERAVGLGAAAHRLIERLADRVMEGPQPMGKGVERGESRRRGRRPRRAARRPPAIASAGRRSAARPSSDRARPHSPPDPRSIARPGGRPPPAGPSGAGDADSGRPCRYGRSVRSGRTGRRPSRSRPVSATAMTSSPSRIGCSPIVARPRATRARTSS